MKPSLLSNYVFATALFASGAAAVSQTTATTDPVGFITLSVAGNGGTGGTALSFKALGLTRPVEYQGSAETVSTNTLIDSQATWTDDQFNGANGAYYVEIISGSGAGTTYDIADTGAGNKTLTLAQNLGAGVANGVSFKIRKVWTVASVFGAGNEAGLQGGSSTSADQILLDDGAGGYTIIYYQTSGLGGTGWRRAGNQVDSADNTALYPDDCLIVKRGQASAVNVVLMGAVKMGQTSVPIVAGNNFVGNVYASGMTLQSCGIYTGSNTTGIAGGTSTSADQLLIPTADGAGYDIYYYQTAGLGGTGWRKAGNQIDDASATALPVANGFIVKRSSGAFDWVIPQHPATL